VIRIKIAWRAESLDADVAGADRPARW